MTLQNQCPPPLGRRLGGAPGRGELRPGEQGMARVARRELGTGHRHGPQPGFGQDHRAGIGTCGHQHAGLPALEEEDAGQRQRVDLLEAAAQQPRAQPSARGCPREQIRRQARFRQRQACGQRLRGRRPVEQSSQGHQAAQQRIVAQRRVRANAPDRRRDADRRCRGQGGRCVMPCRGARSGIGRGSARKRGLWVTFGQAPVRVREGLQHRAIRISCHRERVGRKRLCAPRWNRGRGEH